MSGVETSPAGGSAPLTGGARERILVGAYDLFSRRGVRGVGIESIIARSGVARQTLYRHFSSKQELVLAFLERREHVWTRGWLRKQVERRANDPAERLLAIFEVFDEWFRRADYEGCSFINVMLEHSDPDGPIHSGGASYLRRIRDFLEELARGAGFADPQGFAREWHILMKGSIVAASEGDRDAARRARKLGRLLLTEEGLLPDSGAA